MGGVTRTHLPSHVHVQSLGNKMVQLYVTTNGTIKSQHAATSASRPAKRAWRQTVARRPVTTRRSGSCDGMLSSYTARPQEDARPR